MSEAKTVAFHTLGCKLNFSETSSISRLLEAEGFEKKDFDGQADVYVINTCSVTDNADKECRQLVRRIQRKAPDSTVVITGCYAQLKPMEIASIPGVDLVLERLKNSISLLTCAIIPGEIRPESAVATLKKLKASTLHILLPTAPHIPQSAGWL